MWNCCWVVVFCCGRLCVVLGRWRCCRWRGFVAYGLLLWWLGFGHMSHVARHIMWWWQVASTILLPCFLSSASPSSSSFCSCFCTQPHSTRALDLFSSAHSSQAALNATARQAQPTQHQHTAKDTKQVIRNSTALKHTIITLKTTRLPTPQNERSEPPARASLRNRDIFAWCLHSVLSSLGQRWELSLV
jgi:hypothetical protein